MSYTQQAHEELREANTATDATHAYHHLARALVLALLAIAVAIESATEER